MTILVLIQKLFLYQHFLYFIATFLHLWASNEPYTLIIFEPIEMIVGCINNNKKNVDTETQRKVISDYALANGLIIDVFYNYDTVLQVTESFQTTGHIVLFANIVSIGENLAQVKDNLRLLLSKNLKIISIKENMILESDKNADFLLQGLEQTLDIMKSMISVVAKRALKNKKEQGYKLGRKGSKNKKHIWNGKEDEIKQKLLAGVPRTQVAKQTGMSIFSLYNYINQTPELKQALWGKNDD